MFVDTAFWVAFSDRRDDHHREALGLLHRYGERQFVTTNHIRGETWSMLRRRASHADAVRFVDRLDRSPRVRVVFVTEELEEDAMRWLRRHDERVYSFVDAASFAVMRVMRIGEALTFDEDFAAAGFRIARLEER